MPLRAGIVGFGKIARDEHVPAIARTEGIDLIAVADPAHVTGPVPRYASVETMFAAHPEMDTVILCQPPVARFEAARAALLAGKNVFLEKPPGAAVSEVTLLHELAQERGLTLFAGWHSCWPEPVLQLRAWCAANPPKRIAIRWLEDVRRWHPGQAWIWQTGGFGVFDPGMNALSILTHLLPESIRLIDATLVFPSNRAAPIAASLTMESLYGVPIFAEFDWRQTGPQTWEIVVESESGVRVFSQGGEDAAHTAAESDSALAEDYRMMYRHFVALARARECDVDTAPLQLVADAFMRGRLEQTAPFDD